MHFFAYAGSPPSIMVPLQRARPVPSHCLSCGHPGSDVLAHDGSNSLGSAGRKAGGFASLIFKFSAEQLCAETHAPLAPTSLRHKREAFVYTGFLRKSVEHSLLRAPDVFRLAQPALSSNREA